MHAETAAGPEFFAISADMVRRMSLRMLLVHSPLVGPSSWSRFADAASVRGYPAEIPDLTGVAGADSPMWRYLVDTAVTAGARLQSPFVVVGHSGAGVFLPVIADRLEQRVRAIAFVDAVVPPVTGKFRTSAAMHRLVDSKTVDGTLQPWMDWWPAGLVDDMVPDPADRNLLRGDLPQLPAAFYDEEVPMPPHWASRRCVYLKLSDGYENDMSTARGFGWPTRALQATHLSIVTEPDRILDSLEHLLYE